MALVEGVTVAPTPQQVKVLNQYYNAQPALPTPIARMAEVAPNPTPVGQLPVTVQSVAGTPTGTVNTTPPPAAVRKEVQHYEQAGQYVPQPLRQQLAASGLVGRVSGPAQKVLKNLDKYTGLPSVASELGQGVFSLPGILKKDITNPASMLKGGGMMSYPGGRVPVGARAALGLPDSLQGLAKARALERAANSRMVPFTQDVRAVVQKAAHPVQQGGTLREGQLNVIPQPPAVRRYLIDNRVAMLQDPETGTIVLGPGMTHGEVVDWLQHHNVKGAPSSYTDWMQHEIYAPEKFTDGTIVPARINTDVNTFESDAATIARMRLIQLLQQRGMLGDVEKAIKQTESLRKKSRG